MTGLAIALALLSAVLTAIGTLIRQQATLSGRIGRAWWIGAALSVVAFVLQMGAVVVGSVLLVQPLIVVSVLFELLLQTRWTGRRPTAAQWGSGAAVALGVASFLLFARPVPAPGGRSDLVLELVVLAFLATVTVLFLVARRLSGHVSALLFGIVSGSLFGLVAVQVSGLSDSFVGWVGLLSDPTTYVCLLTIAGAIAAQQRSFARGSLEASYPAMVAAEPVVSMVLSLAVLGEQLSSHSVGTYLGLLGLLVMIAGVIGVARAAAAAEVALREDGLR